MVDIWKGGNMNIKETVVKCERCGYVLITRTKLGKATCSSCGYKVEVPKKD